LHRPVAESGEELDDIFAWQESRKLSKTLTFRYDKTGEAFFVSHSVIESSSDCKILKNVVSVVLSGLFSKLEIVACLIPIFFASSLCVQPFC